VSSKQQQQVMSAASSANGTSKRGPRPRAAKLSRDPLASVMGLGPRIPVAVMVGAAVLAMTLHAGGAVGAVQAAVLKEFPGWARDVHAAISLQLGQTYEIVVPEKKDEPPPPPEPVKEEPKPEPKVEKDPPKDQPPQPPAASQASQVVVREPDKNEPVEVDGFINGPAETANGGITQRGGTSTVANYNPHAVATGTPGGTGTAPAPPPTKVDRSRGARISNLANLERCPFPAEADSDQIDEAKVGVEVKVTPDGRAESVSVYTDPGHGFGREAKKCALRERYDAALNVDGQPIPGTFRVRFSFSR